jgi:radical SAM protein with 4Fe4S-binding SPASM domain
MSSSDQYSTAAALPADEYAADRFVSGPSAEAELPPELYAETRELLAAVVKARQFSLASGELAIEHSNDLGGVLKFLNNPELHDSEGRDLSFDKRSFSRTELRVAGQLAKGAGDSQGASVNDAATVEYLLYRYRFNDYPRRGKVGAFPLLLAVEPTSVCNLRCIMCFQADPRLSEAPALQGFMDFDLYRRVIDEAASHNLPALVLASRGEPLLHKEIFRMIRYAKNAGIQDIKLNTNVTALTCDRSRALLESGVDTVVFSVDAAVKEQFERIRPGASFERVVRNIQEFNDIRRREYPHVRMRSRIYMILLDSSQDTLAAAEFWRGLTDEFASRPAISRLNVYEMSGVSGKRPCSLLWERLYVWWDGKVNVCDEDYLSHLALGNLNDGLTVQELWHGSKMTAYRESHRAGRKDEWSPCRNCPGF